MRKEFHDIRRSFLFNKQIVQFLLYQMKHGIWLVGLSNSQVLHLLIGQWSDKPVNIGTVEVTVYDHLPDKEPYNYTTV